MSHQVWFVPALRFRRRRQTIQGSPQSMAFATAGRIGTLEPADVGNCYSACIASLIGCELDEVPHIQWQRCMDEAAAGRDLPWHDRRLAREWLRTRGLDLANVQEADAISAGVHYIVSVASHAGDWRHAVIGHGGDIVFDPSGGADFTEGDDELVQRVRDAQGIPAPGANQ